MTRDPMVSVAHLCVGPRVGPGRSHDFGYNGAPGSMLHHPTWRNFQWPNLNHQLASLPFDNPSNCLNIATAKSGEVIRVLVRPEDDATKKLIEAVGTFSNDGKSFSVVVIREDGAQQTHD